MEAILANINPQSINFIKSLTIKNREEINQILQEKSGIVQFFDTDDDWETFNSFIQSEASNLPEDSRREYGDFQTNRQLIQIIFSHYMREFMEADVLIEPTFGKGNFIVEALGHFSNLKKVYGIEIYKPYVYQTKFEILLHYLTFGNNPPEIHLFHEDFFGFDFQKIAILPEEKVLILGNPPWINNSQLSTLNSDNLPKKYNRKNLPGLLALTGKGDFDLGESIARTLLEQFAWKNGYMALLLKNATIKNLVYDQKRFQLPIGDLKKWEIDTSEEFNAKTAASLFYSKLNSEPAKTITNGSFYRDFWETISGWSGDKFVYDIVYYEELAKYDGKSPFIWRSGLKHDCSKVMEFERINGKYRNKLGEVFELEDEWVYGIIKSADIQTYCPNPRKFTIVTQRKIGGDTSIIKESAPKTWKYLTDHRQYFDNRKSSIYRNNPPFSIFGIGEYSFAPYKVAISSMYKKIRFNLILPFEGKPQMLDDTCYFIGFEEKSFAEFTLDMLGHPIANHFLTTISFPDQQRVVNKELLGRIDLAAIIDAVLDQEPEALTLGWDEWLEYREFLSSENSA